MIDNKRIHIVPNFAENYLFIGEDNIRDKFVNTEPLRILFLSNLIEGKGYNELVDAYLFLNDNMKTRVVIDYAGGFVSDVHKNEFLNKISVTKGIQYHGIVCEAEKKRPFCPCTYILPSDVVK